LVYSRLPYRYGSSISRTDDSSGSEPVIESQHRISWTDVSSTCKAAVALLLGIFSPVICSRYSSSRWYVRPMVIARSVKLLSLFSLIFSSGLCSGYSSWWYALSRWWTFSSFPEPAVCFQLAVNRSHRYDVCDSCSAMASRGRPFKCLNLMETAFFVKRHKIRQLRPRTQ
jgi:hypothetical protein